MARKSHGIIGLQTNGKLKITGTIFMRKLDNT